MAYFQVHVLVSLTAEILCKLFCALLYHLVFAYINCGFMYVTKDHYNYTYEVPKGFK